jgi:hypothetical protein
MCHHNTSFYGDDGLWKGSHVIKIACYHAFLIENHPLYLRIDILSHLYQMYIVIHDILSSIHQNFQICYPQISNSTFSFSDPFLIEPDSQVRDLYNSSWHFYNQYALVFFMDLQHCHIKYLSSCNFLFNQPTNCYFSCTLYFHYTLLVVHKQFQSYAY